MFIAFKSLEYNVSRHDIVLNSSQASEHNQNSTDFLAGRFVTMGIVVFITNIVSF